MRFHLTAAAALLACILLQLQPVTATSCTSSSSCSSNSCVYPFSDSTSGGTCTVNPSYSCSTDSDCGLNASCGSNHQCQCNWLWSSQYPQFPGTCNKQLATRISASRAAYYRNNGTYYFANYQVSSSMTTSCLSWTAFTGQRSQSMTLQCYGNSQTSSWTYRGWYSSTYCGTDRTPVQSPDLVYSGSGTGAVLIDSQYYMVDCSQYYSGYVPINAPPTGLVQWPLDSNLFPVGATPLQISYFQGGSASSIYGASQWKVPNFMTGQCVSAGNIAAAYLSTNTGLWMQVHQGGDYSTGDLLLHTSFHTDSACQGYPLKVLYTASGYGIDLTVGLQINMLATTPTYNDQTVIPGQCHCTYCVSNGCSAAEVSGNSYGLNLAGVFNTTLGNSGCTPQTCYGYFANSAYSMPSSLSTGTLKATYHDTPITYNAVLIAAGSSTGGDGGKYNPNTGRVLSAGVVTAALSGLAAALLALL